MANQNDRFIDEVTDGTTLKPAIVGAAAMFWILRLTAGSEPLPSYAVAVDRAAPLRGDLAHAAAHASAAGAGIVLDGEIVALVDGAPDFRTVMHRLAPGGSRSRMSATSPEDARRMARTPVRFMAFDVLRAAAAGGTVADIARAVFLSEGTVRNHLSSAIGKTGTGTRVEAAAVARDRGWL